MPAYAVALSWDDGRTERVRVRASESVLDAAEASEIGLPFGCRYGACGTCTAQVLTGALRHRRPPRALDHRRLEAGYVLLCIATPTDDCHVRVGADVQAELVENPWK